MIKLTISAAVLLATVAFVPAPASAEHIGGGPRVQNGKCWVDHGGGHDARFGDWENCPKKASAGDSTCHLGQLAWEKLHVGQLYFDNCAGLGADGKPLGGATTGAASTGAARTGRAVSR
jgi:hypothetical protein